jgi:hypothetical protein
MNPLKWSVEDRFKNPYILTRIVVNQKGALMMKTLPLSEVKMKLSELVDRVHSTDEEVVITKNGRPRSWSARRNSRVGKKRSDG